MGEIIQIRGQGRSIGNTRDVHRKDHTGSGGLTTVVNSRTYLPLSLPDCGFVTSATPAGENFPETIVEKRQGCEVCYIGISYQGGLDGHVRGVWCGIGGIRKLSPEVGSKVGMHERSIKC
jgi:hypothetical protein